MISLSANLIKLSCDKFKDTSVCTDQAVNIDFSPKNPEAYERKTTWNRRDKSFL